MRVADTPTAGAPGAIVPPVLLGMSLKLYLDVERTRQWAAAVGELARTHPAVREGKVRLFVLPSLPALEVTRAGLSGSSVAWGAQDLHWADRGAFTGAVSGTDLAALGCRFVEVGHAERKRLFGEDEEVVSRKLEAAFRNRLTPVLCVGETSETTPDVAAEACIDQLERALAHTDALDADHELVVAYEPEWAIGRDEPAAAEYVRAVTCRLRSWLGQHFVGGATSVIYGGSAQRGTLSELAGSVDGLFLGRFAHRIEDLASIVDEAAAR